LAALATTAVTTAVTTATTTTNNHKQPQTTTTPAARTTTTTTNNHKQQQQQQWLLYVKPTLYVYYVKRRLINKYTHIQRLYMLSSYELSKSNEQAEAAAASRTAGGVVLKFR